ncbi:hypothetical protein yc1106_01428 [Curvularia clavata]|uniref:Ricin B lectin domain-containing protein n=1 Tax=Curvularia clavata TaxID=95742 RepID=A0A9Q9DPZ4_CURCL|nr:hypothetical protein yc1106_01428 [Curvularia clavata]
MSGLELSENYIVRNKHASTDYQLVVTDNDGLSMDDYGNSDESLWYLTATSYDGYFRIHTPEGGDEKALDVSNDNGTSSEDVYLAATEETSGQFWRLDQWDDGSYKLSNNFTGPDVYLGMYSDGMGVGLSSDDGEEQYWVFTNANDKTTSTDDSSSSRATATSVRPAGTQIISTTAPASTASLPAAISPASTHSRGKPLSPGAIIGTAIGGLTTLVLCACALIYALRRKRIKSVRAPAEKVSGLSDYVSATSEKELVHSHVAAQGKQGEDGQERRNTPPAEVAGDGTQSRAEVS